MLLFRVVLALGLALAAAACGADSENTQAIDPASSADGGPAGNDRAKARLSGRVFDAESGQPVHRATVVVDGTGKVQTDAQGAFTLEAKSFASGEITVRGKDYAPLAHAFPVAGGSIQLFLKGLDEKIAFRGDQGVTAKLPNGVRLNIPAHSVIDGKGAKVPGPLTLELAAIDGRKATQAAALPGDGKAVRKNGRHGRVAIADALSIRVYGKDGKDLSVARASKVVAEVPFDKSAAAPAVFSYSSELEQWQEEGKARIASGVAIADIEHLSWWALGAFSESASCVRACVEDTRGEPVFGAQIWVVGRSEPGVSSFFTDASGCGAGDTAANIEATLLAQSKQLVSEAAQVRLDDVSGSAVTAPEACQDLGRLVVGRLHGPSCGLCQVDGLPLPAPDDGGIPDAMVEPLGDAGVDEPGDAGAERDAGANPVADAGTNPAADASTNPAADAGPGPTDAGAEGDAGTGGDRDAALDAGDSTDGGVSAASNLVIDFDGQPGMPNSLSTVPEASRLSAVSLQTATVLFRSAAPFVGVVNLGQGHAISAPNGIGGTNADGALSYASPIVISFFFPGVDPLAAVTDFVRIRGDQLPGSGTATMTAYDADGQVLDRVQVNDVRGGPTLELKARGIQRVEITQTQANIAFDHLEFSPVRAVP